VSALGLPCRNALPKSARGAMMTQDSSETGPEDIYGFDDPVAFLKAR
jgi:hypothetical protein